MTVPTIPTGALAATLALMGTRKNPAAVALGRRRAATAAPGELAEMGKKAAASGGRARAKKLSKKRMVEIAKKAAAARWAKKQAK